MVTRFCLLFGLVLAAAVSATTPVITGWYTESETIRAVTADYIWIVSWSWGAYGLVMCVNASFNGSGRPLPAVVLSSARVIFVLLPLIWVAQHFLGMKGIFSAVLAANLIVGAAAWAWLGRHIDRAASRSPVTAGRTGAGPQRRTP